jgi:hypothetical protein
MLKYDPVGKLLHTSYVLRMRRARCGFCEEEEGKEWEECERDGFERRQRDWQRMLARRWGTEEQRQEIWQEEGNKRRRRLRNAQERDEKGNVSDRGRLQKRPGDWRSRHKEA